MAKPRAQTHLASPATSSSSPRLPKRTYTRRRRQSPSSSRQTIAPSSALLASLATVAAACSAADGRPLAPDSQPPHFLCPFLPLDVQEEYLVPSTRNIRTDDRIGEDEEDVFYLGPTPTRSKRIARRKRGLVPDKYVQGTDGRWRKEGSWTLYGSTYCDCTAEALPPQTAVPEVDDQVDPTTASAVSTETFDPQPASTDMAGSLPSGWEASHTDKDPLTPIILTMSLLLAIVICLFIYGCAVWRKRRRAQVQLQRDLEKKARRILDDESEAETDETRRMRSHQRMWAKATARWKANVRLSLRRRRKRPLSVMSNHETEPRASTTSLVSQYTYTNEPHRTQSTMVDPHPDQDASPSPASITNNPQSPSDIRTNGETPHVPPPSANEVPPDASRPTLPPEYPVDGTLLGARNRRPDHSTERSTASEARAPAEATFALSHNEPAPSALPPPLSADEERLPYTAAANTAHIATDDKTLLARMAHLASQPPPELGDPARERGGSSGACENAPHGEPGPSVPVMDEFEELPASMVIQVTDEDGPSGSDLGMGMGTNLGWQHALPSRALSPSIQLPVPTYSREPSPHPPMFPAPPTKAQLAAPLFYEYPSAFEEDGMMGGELELETPSAPPFEYETSGPSAPPLELEMDLDLEGGGVPLIDEDEEIQLGFASAPPLPPPPLHETDTLHARSASEAHARRRPSPSPASFLSVSSRAGPPDYLP